MEKDFKINPDFDDIVFNNRNKEYGAYVLRKKYSRNVLISILIAILIMATPIVMPYLNARALQNKQKLDERQVVITMENLNQPVEQFVPPPPPPPSTIVVQPQKYVPPQVVDSIKPEDPNQSMTADQANSAVSNKEVVEVRSNAKEEMTPELTEPEPFLMVQEMPEPPGGMPALYKYIAENTRYPAIAEENNIQGKVFVRFCVTSKGAIDHISIYKGVDPALDAEALRVVKTFPQFKPGKQEGIPVPVWFTVYINFTLQ
jgi:protein TonB